MHQRKLERISYEISICTAKPQPWNTSLKTEETNSNSNRIDVKVLTHKISYMHTPILKAKIHPTNGKNQSLKHHKEKVEQRLQCNACRKETAKRPDVKGNMKKIHTCSNPILSCIDV